jgi:hypothetical protein
MTDHVALAALLADPARAAELPVAEVPELLGRLELVKDRLLKRASPSETSASNSVEERLLDVHEAAGRLCVTIGWLRRRPTLPFVVKLSEGVVRYSQRGLESFIRHHTVGR